MSFLLLLHVMLHSSKKPRKSLHRSETAKTPTSDLTSHEDAVQSEGFARHRMTNAVLSPNARAQQLYVSAFMSLASAFILPQHCEERYD